MIKIRPAKQIELDNHVNVVESFKRLSEDLKKNNIDAPTCIYIATKDYKKSFFALWNIHRDTVGNINCGMIGLGIKGKKPPNFFKNNMGKIQRKALELEIKSLDYIIEEI